MKATRWMSDKETFEQYEAGVGHVIRRKGDLTGLHVKTYEELVDLRDFLNDLVCALEDF